MATDATGTPTPNYSIPKFDTATDAPSGNGFNAAMDAIDLALADKPDSPAGIASGEAMVWNGSAWVRSSVTRLSTVRPQDLGQDSANSGDVMTWNGSIWAPAAPAAAGVEVYDRVTTSASAIVSTTTETSIYSKSITGGDLSTNRMLRLKLVGEYVYNTAGSPTATLRVKYGATTILSEVIQGSPNLNAATKSWDIDVYLMAKGSTSSQVAWGLLRMNDPFSSTDGYLDFNAWSRLTGGRLGYGTASEDSTANKTLDVTFQWGTSDASLSWTRHVAILELV